MVPYFADPSQEALSQRVAKRIEEAFANFDFTDCQIAREHLYGESFEMGAQDKVLRTGDEGELVKLNTARAKAIRESLVGQWLSAPISWRVTARNSDAESRAAVQGNQALLEDEWKRGMLGFVGEVGKAGCAYREAYVYPEWSWALGEAEMEDPSTGQAFFEGAIRVRHVARWDVVFDTNYRSWEELPWVAVRTWESREDLAKLYGKSEEEQARIRKAGDVIPSRFPRKSSGEDVVGVWHFFHRTGPAIPTGLELHFIDGKTLLGEPKPCKRIPIKRFCPAIKEDSPHGDSQWQSILGLERMLNSTNSAIATNFDAFATQIVSVDDQFATDTQSLTNVSLIKTPRGGTEPKGVNLTKNPEGYGDWAEAQKADSLDIVGLNDVSQGQPDTAQMNAAAFAILEGAATKRNATAQRRLLDFTAELGQECLLLAAENMSPDKFLRVAGKSSAPSIPTKQVTKAQLGAVAGVRIEIGNALEQSPAGRLQLLDVYRQANPNMPPEDIQQVVETGRLEQATRPERMMSLLVDWENEQIAQGITPQVHARQDHFFHVRKHRVNCENPAILMDAKAAQADQQHFDWHYREYWGLPEGAIPRQDADPMTGQPLYFDRVRIMLGQPPPSQVGPMAQPPAQPSPAGGPAAPSGPPSDSSGQVPPALSQPTEATPEGVPPVPGVQ